MKKYLISILIILVSIQPSIAGKYAQEANDNPFKNGELNLKYEGEKTALAGEILEIKPTKQKFPIYKLNLRIEGIKHIWVASIAPSTNGEIKVGDLMIYKGFISSTSELDPSGELEKIINSKTLLMAIQSQRAK